MDGEGRGLDNVVLEQLRHGIMCDAVYLRANGSAVEAKSGLAENFGSMTVAGRYPSQNTAQLAQTTSIPL